MGEWGVFVRVRCLQGDRLGECSHSHRSLKSRPCVLMRIGWVGASYNVGWSPGWRKSASVVRKRLQSCLESENGTGFHQSCGRGRSRNIQMGIINLLWSKCEESECREKKEWKYDCTAVGQA